MPDQIAIQIPRPTVREGSAFTATAYFRNRATLAADAPSAIKYRLDNLTACETVLDWTTVTPAANVSIAITADQNAIRARCNPTERMQLTVASNPDTATQVRETVEWDVMNIRRV